MRILIIDKTAVLEASHERYEKIAAYPDVELAVLSPVRWTEHMRDVEAQRSSHPDYTIYLGKTFWTGSYSRGFYTTGLKKALREFKPDIIQLLEEPWSLFAGQTVRAARRIAPDAQVLFYTWENIYRERTYCSKLDPLHRRIEASVFANCRSGVCATHLAAEVLRKRGYHGKTPVIPYGINASFLLGPDQIEERIARPVGSPPRIGYVGRLLKMKGVDILIRALPLVEGTLVVLGSGEAERDLKSMARDIGVQDRIEWVRAVPPDEVVSHISALDALVLPSRTTATWAEQLGRVLLEAMACGVPVIVSSSGSIPEVAGEEGLIFPEGDSEALAESVAKLLGDDSLRQEKVRRGHEKVRIRYTWDRFAADLVEHFRSL